MASAAAIRHVIDEIRLEMPLDRVRQLVAIGGDVRLAASQILAHDEGDGIREIPREAFITFCDDVVRLDDDALVARFRLSAGDAETLVPALLVYGTLLSETAAKRLIVSDASLRASWPASIATRQASPPA